MYYSNTIRIKEMGAGKAEESNLSWQFKQVELSATYTH
jgi:hypothetical protein